MAPRTVLVVGLGLIGGSAGMALRARGWRVLYCDPAVREDAALAAGAADERSDIGAVPVDVTIIAAPVDVAVDILRTNRPRGVVVSTCSVMRPIIDSGRAQALDLVAGHPMAGSHESGLQAARPDLFSGKRWFVDRHLEVTDALIRATDAIVDVVDPDLHDNAVALTSHLPQILSSALAAYLDRQPDAVVGFAGSGLATFLRLAGSDASVWKPIIDANRGNVEAHCEAVMAIAREMLRGDLTAEFERARSMWDKLQ